MFREKIEHTGATYISCDGYDLDIQDKDAADRVGKDMAFATELLVKSTLALVSCTVHISPNDLFEFPSATLLSVNDATASPSSAALQTENSSCVIRLKMNGTRH